MSIYTELLILYF